MPTPRFVTNDLFGAPGVYVREIQPTAPVRGIIRNVVGYVGVCVRGPVDRAVECTSYGRFLEVFGGRDYGAGGAIIGEVWKALQEKPIGKFYVIRAAAAAAVKASFTLETAAGGAGTAVVRIDAANPGVWGNDVAWKVSAASDGVGTKFNLTIRYLGKFYTYQNLNGDGSNDNFVQVVGTDDGTLITVTKLAAGRPNNSAGGVDGADTDGYTKLGQVVAGYTSVVGAEGGITDTDFTATGRALEVMNNTKQVSIRAVAGRSNTTVKTKLLALAALLSDGGWLICPDSSATSLTTFRTEVGTLRHGRIFPVFNSPKIRDPETSETITVEPHTFLASVLSQTEPDVHPGVVDNAPYLAGIRELTFEAMAPTDIDAADADGVTVIERTTDEAGNLIFGFANGLTSDLSKNNRQIDGRRMKDYLISGIVARSRGDQFRPNTKKGREARKAAISGWLTTLAKAERYVKSDDAGKPLFEYVNDATVNPSADVAAGTQRDLVRITLIPKNLVLSLQIEAGTDVNVRVAELNPE